MLSLIELKPKTGRTHQLRVQCASRNVPILGDATYGDFRFNRQMAATLGSRRLFLHAFSVSFNYRASDVSRLFEAKAELPEPFKRAFPQALFSPRPVRPRGGNSRTV